MALCIRIVSGIAVLVTVQYGVCLSTGLIEANFALAQQCLNFIDSHVMLRHEYYIKTETDV
jgi:hypothetical protein